MQPSILLCGGAGYIGSTMARFLLRSGNTPVIVDNLTTGFRAAIPPECPFYHCDIRETQKLSQILTHHRISAVIHFAASSQVQESTEKPLKYFDNNVGGTLSLLRAMQKNKVTRIVFSSTAAVYGNPVALPIHDNHPVSPINPYGESKYFIEQVLHRFAEAYDFRAVALRYFNACGAWTDGTHGESHNPETHLIPLVIQAVLGQREMVYIFGNDYATPDGTAVRDYIHVEDLAAAHVQALDFIENHKGKHHFNLGNGNGFSVKEVITAVEKVTGRQIPFRITGRRPGDPAILVADAEKAHAVLSWKPVYKSLEDMVRSAWDWHARNPRGYVL